MYIAEINLGAIDVAGDKSSSPSLGILVVIYNCRVESSETIRSIINTDSDLSKVKLCVWNNGPSSFRDDKKAIEKIKSRVDLTYIETLENSPLSWIYNRFIEVFDCENYVILDHDSSLSEEYLSFITSNKVEFVGVPRIESKGLLCSPTVSGKFKYGPYKRNEFVIAVGSGIVLSKSVALTVKCKYNDIFDERFSLYGVDTSFFARIFRLGRSGDIKLLPGFEHSLSRLENEPKNVQSFRKVERSYDLGLMLRHYPAKSNLKSLVKQLLLMLVGKQKMDLTATFCALFSGRHKKCRPGMKSKFDKFVRLQDEFRNPTI